MRSFVRTRYGCDFCKKIGGSKRHMVKHEMGCTNNPLRSCSMHHFATNGEELAPNTHELLSALAVGGYAKLVEVSHNCPACKLAALRQSRPEWEPGEPFPLEPQDGREKFDYRKEVQAMWAEYRESEREQHGYPCVIY